MLSLSENYRIVYEESNIVLQYYEQRMREKTKTGEKEEYEFKENYYYPDLKSSLRKYLQLSLEGSESIEEVLKRITEVETVIKNIKTK